jgi:hypothetical protein
MVRWSVVLLVVVLGACGGCNNAGERGPAPRIVDLPGGGKRVRLYGNQSAGVDGEGWKIATGEILPGPDDTDFHLTMAMVISLFPSQGESGFCQKQPAAGAPAFARVEDVPGDAASCAGWSPAYLGGNSNHTDSLYAGQGFLVRDRAGLVAARLLTVADDVMNGDVNVTFDIIGL